MSGGDDKLIKIWELNQNVHSHSGSNNISFVMFQEIPIILSSFFILLFYFVYFIHEAAEDGVLKIWHSLTYRYETQLLELPIFILIVSIKHNPFGHAFSINDDHEY